MPIADILRAATMLNAEKLELQVLITWLRSTGRILQGRSPSVSR